MDLDNEELIVTKFESVKEEKSEADKLFKELGYEFLTEIEEIIIFLKGNLEICFYKGNKIVEISTDTGEIVFGNAIYGSTELSFKEIEAIYLKCKELGFSEE